MRNIFLLLLMFVLYTGCIEKQEHVDAHRVTTGPTVDGVLDNTWNRSAWEPIYKFSYNREFKKKSISAAFKVLWDDERCYFFVKVKDDIKYSRTPSNDPFEKKYDFDKFIDQNDQIQICFFSDGYVYGKTHNVYNFKFIYNYLPVISEFAVNSKYKKNILCRTVDTNDGYQMEIGIPWKAMDIKPQKGLTLGMRITVIDNDNNVIKAGIQPFADSAISWSGSDKLQSKEFGSITLDE